MVWQGGRVVGKRVNVRSSKSISLFLVAAVGMRFNKDLSVVVSGVSELLSPSKEKPSGTNLETSS